MMKYHLILLTILSGLFSMGVGQLAVQAQTRSQLCTTVIANDQINRYRYPTKSIPENIAIDNVQRQIANFADVVALTAPGKLEKEALDRQLFLWLLGNPTARAPQAPYNALLEDLLRVVKTDADRNQVVMLLDQLTAQLPAKIEGLAMEDYMVAIARFYSQLNRSDRAGSLLEQRLQLSLKQPDVRLRNIEIGRILKTAIDLNQSAKMAPYADRIAVAIEPAIKVLTANDAKFAGITAFSLAELYGNLQQPEKGLKLIDRIAKLLPKDGLNPEIPRLYLQLGKADQAQVYLDRMMQVSFYDEIASYGKLAATYEKVTRETPRIKKTSKNTPQIIFQRIWNQMQDSPYDNQTPFLRAYFQAGGNPELAFQTLKAESADRQIRSLLTVAGEYNKRGQKTQANQAIDLFVQSINANQNAVYALSQAVNQGYAAEAGIAFQKLSRLNRITADAYMVEVAEKTNQLELAEPLIQKLLKTDPDSRIDLLKQLAIAYARQGNVTKAVTIAERIPRREAQVSSAIDTLTQVATQLHLRGNRAEAETVWTKTAQIVAGIKDLPARSIAYGAMAREYQRIGRNDDARSNQAIALRTARSIPKQPNQGMAPEYTLARLAQQYVDARQVQAAWQTLQAIPATAYAETNLTNTLIAAIEAGDLTTAGSIAAFIDRHQTAEMYLSIANQLANAYLAQNKTAEAKQVAVRSAEILLKQKERSPDTLTSIARLLGQLGQKELAQTLLANYPSNPGSEVSQQELKAALACY